MSRKRNSINNLVWGIACNVITSVIAIMIPRLFIVNYGSEVNGLLSSIRQIYVYLALLEVGVGDASVVALYGPIGRGDYQKANGILSATNHFYKRIGMLYILCLSVLGLVYPLFLDTEIPYTVCVLVIILQGSGSVISYFVQGKYNMLLRVDNRSYVTTNLGTLTSVLTDGCRIFLLLRGKSIIAVQTTYLFFDLLKMAGVLRYIKKHYKWLDLSVKPDFDAISQRKAVFTHQISALVFSHTDVLVLTFVCGLKTVSVYSMYATVCGMVSNLIQITANSVQAAMGQIFHSDRKKFLMMQEAYETYYLALVFSLFSIATVCFLPFIRLYTRGADINYADAKLVALFIACQLLTYGRVTSNNIVGFMGAFRETQWRAWLETIINITVSLICVFRFGIYGVLMGTIAALLYRANDIILFANRVLLKRSAWPTYRRWFTNLAIFALVVFLWGKVPLEMDSYVRFFLCAAGVGIVNVAVFFGIDSLIEKEARTVAWRYLKEVLNMLKRK